LAKCLIVAETNRLMNAMLVSDVGAIMQVSDVAAICCQLPLNMRIAAQTAWTGGCVDSPLVASTVSYVTVLG